MKWKTSKRNSKPLSNHIIVIYVVTKHRTRTEYNFLNCFICNSLYSLLTCVEGENRADYKQTTTLWDRTSENDGQPALDVRLGRMVHSHLQSRTYIVVRCSCSPFHPLRQLAPLVSKTCNTACVHATRLCINFTLKIIHAVTISSETDSLDYIHRQVEFANQTGLPIFC